MSCVVVSDRLLDDDALGLEWSLEAGMEQLLLGCWRKRANERTSEKGAATGLIELLLVR
jgi:hypothetical protein